MMLLVLLSLSMCARADTTPSCEGVVVDSIIYNLEDLTTLMEKPSMLALDHNINTIYFCHNTTLSPTKLDLDTHELAILRGFTSEVTALAVDSDSHDLYLGEDGIYKLNYFENVAKPYAMEGYDIISLLYNKGILYALHFPTYEVYAVTNGHHHILQDVKGTVVEKFVIDKNDVFYYSNHTGLFSQKLGKSSIQNAKTIFKSHNHLEVRALTTDYFGNIFVSLSNGIYKLNTENSTLHMMYPTENAYDIAVDLDGNLIFSNLRRLIKVTINLMRTCGKQNNTLLQYNSKREEELKQTVIPLPKQINIKKYTFDMMTTPVSSIARSRDSSYDESKKESSHPNQLQKSVPLSQKMTNKEGFQTHKSAIHRVTKNSLTPQRSRIKYPRAAEPLPSASVQTVSEMLRHVQIKLIDATNLVQEISTTFREFFE